MEDVAASIDRVARDTGFSGVVRVDRDGEVAVVEAYGMAHRPCDLANTVDTRFGIASGTKGLTALAVVGLVDQGRLELATRARSMLGDDLPLIDDDVTVEHLLAHRSGIGDYLDEDADYDMNDYVLPVPVHELATTEQYRRVLDGYPHKFAAGSDFSYCNSGYVVLALIAERAAGIDFHDLVEQQVCAPAGMRHTAFLRSDELPADTAIGYLDADGMKTNVLHLPVRGSGDGGIYSTAADIHALWAALFAGRVVPPRWVGEMLRPRSDVPSQSMRYGWGFWLHQSRDVAVLEGADAGVSFRSVHDPTAGVTHTVLSNTTSGAWPIARLLRDQLSP